MKNNKSGSNQDFNYYMGELEKNLQLYLVDKAPAIPTNIKDVIVKIAPWLVLIGVIFAIPAILALFGLSAVLLPFGIAGRGLGLNHMLSVILLAIAVILEALSIRGLMNRKVQGWRYAYYAVLINALSNIVAFDIVGAIIGFLISMYVLFQVRSYYK
jgi:hypothetical protein